MGFECSSETGGRIFGTHVIGHAHGNNDIAKDVPNIPYLQVMTLDNWEQSCVVVHTPMALHWMAISLAPPNKVKCFFGTTSIPTAIPPPS